MANEIRATYDTGYNLYALIFDAAGQVWDQTNDGGNGSFEAYAAASIDNYDVVLSEIATASGQYRGTFDSHVSAGVYSVALFLRAGASPAVTDSRIGRTSTMYWDGTAEITLNVIDTVVDSVLTDTNTTLPASLAAMVTDIASTNTWYVAKSGNDGNAGTSWSEAFLTNAAALAASASGDTIKIGPGTYTEAIDLATATKSLTLQGTEAALCIITAATGNTITFYNNCTVRNLSIVATHATNGMGVYAGSVAYPIIEDCIIIGTYDGIYAALSSYATIRRNKIIATYDAVNLASASRFAVTDCVIYTDCSYTGATCRGIIAPNAATSGTIRDCQILALRTDNQDYTVSAVELSGRVAIYNCVLRAQSSHADADGNITGVKDLANAVCISLKGCKIWTSSAGGGTVKDIVQAVGTVSVTSTLYDQNKTTGTIINLDRDAIVNDATRFAGANVATIAGNVAAILVDTGTTLPTTLTTISNYVDTVETLLATISGYVDTLETSAAAITAYVDTVEATLALIKVKTDLITTGQIEISAPVAADGDVTIVRGDSYLDADSRALTWTSESWSTPSLTSATGKLRFISKSDYDAGSNNAELEVTVAVTMDGTTATFKADLTAANTADLTASPPEDRYNYIYQLIVTTVGGSILTIALGSVYIKEDIAA